MNEQSIIETIKQRRSIRTFQEKRLSDEDYNKITFHIKTLNNPFGVKVNIYIVNKSLDKKGEKLGTYGVIKGAETFLGVTVHNEKNNFIAAGYEFENLILYAASIGLGTVWLAATFSKKNFASAMGIKDDELFPAISPIGYPAEKRSIKESIMRSALKSDNRKPWEELFFNNNFDTPIHNDETEDYQLCLEMMRLAPSSKNQQPWRVVKKGGIYHFFAEYSKKISDEEKAVKEVDMGISLYHFHKTAETLGKTGSFKVIENLDINIPENIYYIISWVENN
ncbi:MAG TPA: hypothetical protein H9804_01305 [Candidatus Mucispirillum faecigallinarum]|uniref:Putative nitroreductase TM1586 domain-containing protein n=1 Tax=Candidatus Mucispirillum faecigallinarum TaxID=2838699 RepID=A0A9D2GRD6_9BACT|nr:hypothetical protein [Candidatus Mucispirillum faecigallinarum]